MAGRKCEDKARYQTEQLAINELKRINKTVAVNKMPMSVYHCLKCGRWHLTSLKSEKQKIKELKLQVKELGGLLKKASIIFS